MPLKGKVAIIGAGMTQYGELFDKSFHDLLAEAFLNAVGSVDKGLDPKEIQAIWFGTAKPHMAEDLMPGGSTVAEDLGLCGIAATRIENVCASGSDSLRNAVCAVASGAYDIALAIGVEKLHERPPVESVLSYGGTLHPVWQHGYPPSAIFAMYATRHMHEYGTTREQMALVSVKNHHHGILNPYAQYRYEVTVDRVLNAPIVSKPLTLLDSCAISDGSAAAIICNIDLAKKYTDSPICVAGFGFGTDYTEFHNKESFTSLLASVRASRAAYRMAGVGPKDIDVIELHDCFTITEIISYEDLGLCKKGEGGKLIQNGQTEVGGSIPVNPDGGLLSRGHPEGATGLAQINEIFKQLRNEAGKRQCAIKHGYGLQHNVGGHGASLSCVNILTNRS